MAKRKSASGGQADLPALRERLILTLRFIEDVQEFPSGQQMRSIVEDAASKRDIRSLRLLAKEIDAMTIALAPHERDGLEALLLSRLGVDKDIERADLQRQVARVLERGSIASEKERRRLEEYVEMLEVTGGDPKEAESVRQLIRSR